VADPKSLQDLIHKFGRMAAGRQFTVDGIDFINPQQPLGQTVRHTNHVPVNTTMRMVLQRNQRLEVVFGSQI
jgi:hypothetical protein